MKEVDLFGYKVEIDEAATKEWYDNADEWGCECGDCRNFVALAKQRELPSTVIETLGQFEIAPEKATYVCEIFTEGELSLYQFSYRIAGNILQETCDEKQELGWGEAYCKHEIYPYGAPGFPTPHFDLEFSITISPTGRAIKNSRNAVGTGSCCFLYVFLKILKSGISTIVLLR